MRNASRIVKSIEKAFYAFSDIEIHHVGFLQLKDWINGHTKEGISSPRLGSVLSKHDQFKRISKIRMVGSNITETYWGLTGDVDVPESRGWVIVKDANDDGIQKIK
jgi:hypothetical protein